MPHETNQTGSSRANAPAPRARTYVVLALTGSGDAADFVKPLGTVVAAGRRAAGEIARLVYGGANGTLVLRVVAAGSVSAGMLVRALARDGDRMAA